jgi:TonB family protein
VRTIVAVLVLSVCTTTFIVAQQDETPSAEEVEHMLTAIGVRQEVEAVRMALGDMFAKTAVDIFKRNHPQATPEQLQKVSSAAAQYMQESMKLLSYQEILDSAVPVYQRYLTRSDTLAITQFFSSASGQKLVKNKTAMLTETMQASQALVQKHQPELQALSEKLAKEVSADLPPTTSPPIPPPTPNGQTVEVASSTSQDLLVSQVPPVYPAVARAARIQGTVVLSAVIDKDGTVESLSLVSGHPLLVPAAMDAVKQWRFRPYTLNGQPVEVKTQINVNFHLDAKSP